MIVPLAKAARIILVWASLFALSGCEVLLGAKTAERFPPPGRLIDIGGRKLQIDCRGKGSPTVILEAGGNNIYGSLTWATVQDDIAATTRVCSYSRAGIMWSDSRREPLDSEGIAHDLHKLLQLAHEAPPYVLVGHSRGAMFNLIYTDLYGSDVAGLVFVEPAHPEQEKRREKEGIAGDPQPLASVKLLRALDWTGLPRAFSGFCRKSGVPDAVVAACKAWFPHSLDGYISETEVLDALRERAGKVRNLGNRPVLVLSRQLPASAFSSNAATKAEQQRWEAVRHKLHAEIASWSSRGVQRMVPDSDHEMMLSQPGAVVAAVKEVVAQTVLELSSGSRTAVPQTQRPPAP
ncbi:MAG TPA: alpha/beta hydrolase [Candidatus Acidoferrum sp.]|nr:alpha/beta hydrolase [Candidatus Acidoferrum sp.]